MGKAEQTEKYIIKTAAVLFNKKGSTGTSVSEIMALVKITKGGLYGRFISKEDLYLACTEHLLEAWLAGLKNAMAKVPTAAEKLEVFFKWYEAEAIASPYGGSPVINFSTESDDLSADVKKKTGELISRLIKLLSEIITKGIAQGELSVKLNADSFAMRTLSAVEGGAALTRANGNLQIIRSVFSDIRSEIKRPAPSDKG